MPDVSVAVGGSGGAPGVKVGVLFPGLSVGTAVALPVAAGFVAFGSGVFVGPTVKGGCGASAVSVTLPGSCGVSVGIIGPAYVAEAIIVPSATAVAVISDAADIVSVARTVSRSVGNSTVPFWISTRIAWLPSLISGLG